MRFKAGFQITPTLKLSNMRASRKKSKESTIQLFQSITKEMLLKVIVGNKVIQMMVMQDLKLTKSIDSSLTFNFLIFLNIIQSNPQ